MPFVGQEPDSGHHQAAHGRRGNPLLRHSRRHGLPVAADWNSASDVRLEEANYTYKFFAYLLQIVGDPKATAERIKQLEAATKENYATLADLQKTRADLDTREAALKEDEVRIAKTAAQIEADHATLDRREKGYEKRDAELRRSIEMAGADKEAFTKQIEQAKAEMDTAAKALTKVREELDQREADLDTREKALEADRTKAAAFEKQLHERSADLDKRFELLKALVA